MKKRLVIITLFIQQLVVAQDAHLSIYDAAPLYLNPAMTGVFEGDWRIHGQYRTQWRSVNFKPYQTGLISFDMSKNKWGFGAQISNFRAGQGNFNAAQGTVSVAYTTPIDRKKNHNLSFGIQGGLTQKSVEYQLLTYNNQYSTANGGTFDMGMPSGEAFEGQSLVIPNVNAGLLYFFARQQARLNPFIGVSAFNLTTPQETFYDADNRLPIRYYGHFGTRINITELLYITPKVLVMNQEEYWEQTYAADAGYYMKEADMYLTAGLLFRTVGFPKSVGSETSKISSDAMLITAGAKLENITVRVGYDLNISSLSTVSNGRGGFELSLTYVNQKRKTTNEKICPRI
jgi:type IX secretion system PorP/SprF family membrane protein